MFLQLHFLSGHKLGASSRRQLKRNSITRQKILNSDVNLPIVFDSLSEEQIREYSFHNLKDDIQMVATDAAEIHQAIIM